MSVHELCWMYYDVALFPEYGGFVDWQDEVWDSLIGAFSKSDPGFLSVDRELFVHEMIALNLEIVGLAFVHLTNRSLSLAQSSATYDYLHDGVKDQFWDDMGAYNNAVASVISNRYNQPTKFQRFKIAYTEAGRLSCRKRYVGQGHDAEYVIYNLQSFWF